AGLAWIGPPAAAMRAMADKAQALRRMRAAGVPVLPGFDGAAQDAATLRAEASRLGYPLMVKAVAGGGGRGMRLVAGEDERCAAGWATPRSPSLERSTIAAPARSSSSSTRPATSTSSR